MPHVAGQFLAVLAEAPRQVVVWPGRKRADRLDAEQCEERTTVIDSGCCLRPKHVCFAQPRDQLCVNILATRGLASGWSMRKLSISERLRG